MCIRLSTFTRFESKHFKTFLDFCSKTHLHLKFIINPKKHKKKNIRIFNRKTQFILFFGTICILELWYHISHYQKITFTVDGAVTKRKMKKKIVQKWNGSKTWDLLVRWPSRQFLRLIPISATTILSGQTRMLIEHAQIRRNLKFLSWYHPMQKSLINLTNILISCKIACQLWWNL